MSTKGPTATKAVSKLVIIAISLNRLPREHLVGIPEILIQIGENEHPRNHH